MEGHNSKTSTSNPTFQQLIPVTTGTSHPSLVPPALHTVDIHDPKKCHPTKPTKSSTESIDNTLITSNRRHHPSCVKYYTQDS